MRTKVAISLCYLCFALMTAYGQNKNAGIDQNVWQKALQSLREGKHNEALEQFKVSLGEKPGLDMTLMAGRTLRQNEATNQAQDLYLWARKTLKRKDIFSFELGELYQLQQKYREAIREFGRSASLDPPRALGKFNELVLQIGRKNVIKLAELEISADNDDTRWLMGELHRESGDLIRSWGYFRELKDEKRRQSAVGRLVADQGKNLKAAITVLSEYLDREKNDRSKWEMVLADLYLQNREYKKAEKILVHLSQEKNPLAQLELSRLWLEQDNDPGKALRFLEEHKGGWPDSLRTEGEFVAGQCLAASEDWAGALDKYSKLVAGNYSGSTRQRALFMSGEIQTAAGLAEEAMKFYQQAAKVSDSGLYANDALLRMLLISQAKTDKITTLEVLSRAVKYKVTGQNEKARQEYMVLADSASGMMAGDWALSELADMELSADRYQQAIDWLKKLEQRTEDELTAAKAFYRVGWIYRYDLGQDNKGLESWRAGILKYPNTCWAESMRREIDLAKETN